MDSLKLVQQLNEMINKNPETLFKMDWRELELCMSVELDYRRSIYSESQFRSLQVRLKRIVEELCEIAQKRGDVAIGQKGLAELIGFMEAMPEIDSYYNRLCQAEFDHEALRHNREKTTIVLGDSHVGFFSGGEGLSLTPIGHDINVCKAVEGFPFTVLHCGPCLAYTCNSKDSSYGFYTKSNLLKKTFISRGARIIVSLGEIDIRAHIFKEAEKQGRIAEDIAEDVLAKFLEYLVSLKEEGYDVFCWGPVATQPDNDPATTGFPHFGTEIERNRMTEYYNSRLEKLCDEKGIGFLTIFHSLITEDYRTRIEYYSEDHFHLGQKAMAMAKPLLQQSGIWHV